MNRLLKLTVGLAAAYCVAANSGAAELTEYKGMFTLIVRKADQDTQGGYIISFKYRIHDEPYWWIISKLNYDAMLPLIKKASDWDKLAQTERIQTLDSKFVGEVFHKEVGVFGKSNEWNRKFYFSIHDGQPRLTTSTYLRLNALDDWKLHDSKIGTLTLELSVSDRNQLHDFLALVEMVPALIEKLEADTARAGLFK